MKVTYLFFSSFIATAVWALNPLGLFAEVYDVLWPLSKSGTPQESNDTLSILIYGRSRPEPLKVLLKSHYLATSDMKYVGVYKDMLSIDHRLSTKRRLQMDREKRLVNGPFYSCNFKDDLHFILVGSKYGSSSDCFEVKIYILPYDRKTFMPYNNHIRDSSASAHNTGVKMYHSTELVPEEEENEINLEQNKEAMYGEFRKSGIQKHKVEESSP